VHVSCVAAAAASSYNISMVSIVHTDVFIRDCKIDLYCGRGVKCVTSCIHSVLAIFLKIFYVQSKTGSLEEASEVYHT